MQTIRYYISWLITAVAFVIAAILLVSWGRETYQWNNAKDIAHEQIEDSSQYAEGRISQLITYGSGNVLSVKSPDMHVYYLASDGSNDGRWFIINVPDTCREDFEAHFDKETYAGSYSYKIKPVKVASDYGVDNIVKMYNEMAAAGVEFNMDRHQIVTDYYIDYAAKETSLSVWKLFIALTLVIIAIPGISTIRTIGKNDSLEYITTPDEYCRQRIEEIDKRIDKEDRIEVLESELESVYENNRIYKRKYMQCKIELVVSLIMAALTAVCIWLAVTKTEYKWLLTDSVITLFLLSCTYISRCVRNLAKNQFNKMSMLLAIQAGGTPLKAELFINEVLITRYEDRIAQLKEKVL